MSLTWTDLRRSKEEGHEFVRYSAKRPENRFIVVFNVTIDSGDGD